MMFINWICGIICLSYAVVMLHKGDTNWFLVDMALFLLNTLFALSDIKRRLK
jgi:hypothetical protein